MNLIYLPGSKTHNKEELIDGTAFWETVDVQKCTKYIRHLCKVVPNFEVIKTKGAATGHSPLDAMNCDITIMFTMFALKSCAKGDCYCDINSLADVTTSKVSTLYIYLLVCLNSK